VTARSRRLLIVLFGALGDVTRALPLLCRLRRGFPDWHLAWAVEPLAAPLLDGHPALDERIVFQRSAGLRGFLSFVARVRRGRFDLVLDLGRLLKSGVTSASSGAPVRVGFHRRNGREGNWLFQTESIPVQAHYSSKLEQYLRFADHVGAPDAPVEFGLAPTPAERERARALLDGVRRPATAFVLGSSCPSRRWFADRTAEVARVLWREHGQAAVLVGTEADRTFATAVRQRLDVPVCDLVGRTTLRDLVGVLAETALVVTPDSGAMHVAAALGVPVVSVWGATSAARSAPYGSTAHAVMGAAACAPCYRRWCPIGRVCMESIEPRVVLGHVERVLGAARASGRVGMEGADEGVR
jgi:ADP-heptose:LPS heptosyltransferase